MLEETTWAVASHLQICWWPQEHNGLQLLSNQDWNPFGTCATHEFLYLFLAASETPLGIFGLEPEPFEITKAVEKNAGNLTFVGDSFLAGRPAATRFPFAAEGFHAASKLGDVAPEYRIPTVFDGNLSSNLLDDSRVPLIRGQDLAGGFALVRVCRLKLRAAKSSTSKTTWSDLALRLSQVSMRTSGTIRISGLRGCMRAILQRKSQGRGTDL
jgi:hypothetical protein